MHNPQLLQDNIKKKLFINYSCCTANSSKTSNMAFRDGFFFQGEVLIWYYETRNGPIWARNVRQYCQHAFDVIWLCLAEKLSV